MFRDDVLYLTDGVNVGSHYILHNILHTCWVLLFGNFHFSWSEAFLILNFLNLSWLYFRFDRVPTLIHASVISGPLAWTFVAIYWNGALLVPDLQSLVTLVIGNVFIWGIFGYGAFFICIFRVSLLPRLWKMKQSA